MPSRGEADLAQGARAGLLQVLVRVSGSTYVEGNRMIAAALRKPADYYYQYGYESTDKTLFIDGQDVPARVLRISFDPSAIARLLRDAGYPVWGSNRPGMLVWIAYSDGQERRILSGADPGEIVASLNRQAKYRGLPLLYPLLDLEDAARLTTAEVWGLFLDRVDLASMRYNPDVILIGRVQQDDGQWTGHWNFRIEDRWQSRDNLAFSADEVVSGVVNELADSLASRYALDSSRGSVMLRVEGIKELNNYAEATAYLQSLTPVVDSFALEVDGDRVLFQLNTEGQSGQLMEIIGLDQKMLLISEGQGTVESPLRYRWVGP